MSRHNAPVEPSGWGLNGRPCAFDGVRQGECPLSPCPRSPRVYLSQGLSTRCHTRIGPGKGLCAGGTATERKGRTCRSIRACVPGTPGRLLDPGRADDEGLYPGHRRRRREGRKDRVLGPQVACLQDQEEPQGALRADEHRRSLGRSGRNGAPHGHRDGRDPLHHRQGRGARDRAVGADAQGRPRRPSRRP